MEFRIALAKDIPQIIGILMQMLQKRGEDISIEMTTSIANHFTMKFQYLIT